jgi:hypothetical protein
MNATYERDMTAFTRIVGVEFEKLQAGLQKAQKAGDANAVRSIGAAMDKLNLQYSEAKAKASEPVVKDQENRFTKWFSEKYGQDVSKIEYKDANASAWNKASRDMLDNFSGHAPLESVYELLQSAANPTKFKQKESGGQEFTTYKVGTSNEVMLPSSLAGDLMGKNEKVTLGKYMNAFGWGEPMDTNEDTFGRMWEQGMIRDISIVPKDKAVSYIDRNGDNVKAVKAEAYVPMSSFRSAGISRGSWVPFTEDRETRLKKDLNAKIIKDSDDNEFAVFDVYYPLADSSFGNYMFDVKTTKGTLGTKGANAQWEQQYTWAFE